MVDKNSGNINDIERVIVYKRFFLENIRFVRKLCF